MTPIEKLIYMADGLFVYKLDAGYIVKDQHGYTLKTAKTIRTCDRYVDAQLKSRRAAEREAIEKANQDKKQHPSIL